LPWQPVRTVILPKQLDSRAAIPVSSLQGMSPDILAHPGPQDEVGSGEIYRRRPE